PAKVTPSLYLSYRRGELLAEVPANIEMDSFWDGTSQRSIVQRALAKARWPCGARAAHLRDVIATRKPDVVMSWALMCSYELALAGIGRTVPHVVYLLNELNSEVDAVFPPRFPFRQQLARWSVRSAAKVLANSLVMRENAIRFFRLSPERVTTLFNYRDFGRIDRLLEEPSPEWPGQGFRIAAIGRLVPQKGFDVLLAAAAKLRDRQVAFQLAILGQGPLEADLRRQIDELRLQDHVHLLGFQRNPYGYLKSADLFVLSSRFEGLPGVLIEALACRTPVVSTDCPTGPREILGEGEFGPLTPVDDANALAEAMQRVLEQPPPAETRERARQSVLERYETQNCLRQLEAILEQVR
ncbi:MAG: glycosyltransferase, partial [Planctomycetaceae bacterium]